MFFAFLSKKSRVFLQYLLPHHGLSRFIGMIAACRWWWVKNLFITGFIRHYGVDMTIAQESSPQAYASFNDFFIRRLQPAERPLSTEAQGILCPTDGIVSQQGMLQAGRLIQAKNRDYSALELLGGDEQWALRYEQGQFVTLYLAPKDYHRIHMPVAGTLASMVYVPGRLFSVNLATAAHIPRLFARNERVVCHFNTAMGAMTLVLVGAMIVASIATSWAGIIAPHRPRRILRWTYPALSAPQLAAGEEMGYFCLGSTVILLTEKSFEFHPVCQEGSVQMGQLLGKWLL